MNISIRTNRRVELVDITSLINSALKKAGIKEGVCTIYIPHTTAGILINESYDPAVKDDILNWLDDKVARNGDYLHSEGNADAHIKSTLVGNSVALIVSGNELLLGRWQGVFFAEFDGPRQRNIWLKVSEG